MTGPAGGHHRRGPLSVVPLPHAPALPASGLFALAVASLVPQIN